MLWYRFWLETRLRLIFVVVWSAFFFGVGLYPVANRPAALPAQVMNTLLLQTTFIAFLAAGFFGGSGVRTQTFGRNYRGLHGSVHFTLSLPVSRTRLLITRAALGFAEMMIVMVLVSVAAWAAFGAMRAQASMSAVIGHAVFMGIAAVGVAGLAVLGSTVFDDVVQTWIVTAVTILLFVFRAQLPRPLDLIGAMTGGSPLVSSTVPWATLAAALVVGTLCVVAALRVVTVQEY